MNGIIPYLGAAALFVIGLRLSAFFSGAETGFYRASYLRLTIDAQSGDPLARRILWFWQHPSHFVVTAMIGNNVAHYVLTVAVGIVAVRAGLGEGMAAEIVSTLLMAPIVFAFGELIPKNLYYRAPLQLLRRDIGWFFLFYRLFLPISFPLMAIARLVQRVGRTKTDRTDQLLGRSRLTHVLSQGRQEGLLTDVQSRLIEGLMPMAAQAVTQSVVPAGRVLGVPDNCRREDVLDFARRYGVSNVAVRRPGASDSWYGYLRVADVVLTNQPLSSLVREMPVIDARANKLEALLALRTSRAAYGLVKASGQVIGLAGDHGLEEQLFRAPPSVASRAASPHH